MSSTCVVRDRCDTAEPVDTYATRQLLSANAEDAPNTARQLQKWKENQNWKKNGKWAGNSATDSVPKWQKNVKWQNTSDGVPKWQKNQKWLVKR